MAGRASNRKNKNAMQCYKNADYLLWQPLIGKKPKEEEEEEDSPRQCDPSCISYENEISEIKIKEKSAGKSTHRC